MTFEVVQNSPHRPYIVPFRFSIFGDLYIARHRPMAVRTTDNFDGRRYRAAIQRHLSACSLAARFALQV